MADDLSFEETLSGLLGVIGERVEVMITSGKRGEPSLTVGFMEGTLTRGMDRGPAVMPDLDADVAAWNEHDAQFFVVGDNGGTGFYIAPQAFSTARWLSADEHDLWIEQGAVVTSVIVPSRVRRS